MTKQHNDAALFVSLRKYFICFSFVVSFVFFTWIAYASTHPQLPSKKHPLTLYSNQCRDDLKLVFLRAIESAQSSIFLVIYGLTDEEVIKALQVKVLQGVDVKIFYDPTGSKNLSDHFLEKVIAFPLKSSGIMHKKILVIDHEKVLLGSANLTETSLSMHDNLVLGCYDGGLCSFFENSLSDSYLFTVGGQSVELWSLPEPEKKVISRILDEIDKARKSLRICMFTFTNKEITEALLKAKERGVKVEVALDYYSAKGSSKDIFKTLQEHGIAVYTSKGGKLLHHKWCQIDEKLLILGSTNWTAAAFTKNDDCVIFLHDLSSKQITLMKTIWDTLDFAIP